MYSYLLIRAELRASANAYPGRRCTVLSIALNATLLAAGFRSAATMAGSPTISWNRATLTGETKLFGFSVGRAVNFTYDRSSAASAAAA
jgi:hypothetical protein